MRYVGEPFIAAQRPKDQGQSAVPFCKLFGQLAPMGVPTGPEQLGCGPDAGITQPPAVVRGHVLVEQRLVEPIDQP